ECPVGFSCLNQSFPQTDTRACAPGLPGWICKDQLGCAAGSCDAWKDVGGPFDGFTTCAPACVSDADCVIYDRPGNPNLLTPFTGAGGRCRQLQSLFFTTVCIHDGEHCLLDPNAICSIPDIPDAGAPANANCNLLPNGGQPMGMLNTQTLCQLK